MSNKSTKSEDFYSRFKDQLLESQDWPGIYIFKFIVKDKSEEYDQLKKYLNNYLINPFIFNFFTLSARSLSLFPQVPGCFIIKL